MARTKRGLHTAIPAAGSEDHDALDVGSVTALLSADYPLVDAPLIIALLSDYDPLLESHIDEVRSQLGIIEATLIPDTDVPEVVVHDDSEPSLDALSDNAVPDVDRKLAQFALNDPAPFAATPAQLQTSLSSKPSRSASASGSRTSGTSSITSPTSVGEPDAGFEDDVTLLKSLFPSIDVKTLKDALVSESGVPAAIDHLLSVELIRDVEREGRWPGESDQDTDHDEPEPSHPTRVELVKTLADPSLSIAPPELRRSRSKKKNKPKAVPLVDTLQRRSNPPSRPSSRQSSRASSPIRGGPSSNAWGTVSSLAGYLSELIPPQPTTFFLAYLHSPKYHSAYSAVRAALANVAPANAHLAGSNSPARGILEDVYGVSLATDPAAKADLELCFKAVGEDVAVVMDLMDLLGEISEWPGDDDLEVAGRGMGRSASVPRSAPSSPRPAPKKILRREAETSSDEDRPHEAIVVPKPVRAAPNTERLTTRPLPMADLIPSDRVIPGAKAPPSAFSSPTAYDTFGLPSNFASGLKRSKSKDRQVHPQNWRNVDHTRMRREKILHPLARSIPSYARGITPHDDTPNSLYHPTNPSINDCLSRAAAERQKREDAVRAAGRSYRLPGGKSLNGAVAGAYALQAREATERAREWELQAARMVVARQMDSSGYTIDLHHMTVHEAVTVALESAAKWYDRQKRLYDESVKVESRARGIAFVPPKGLTVVVGVGRHSAGKVGVIGPAVGNALEASGWRVDRGEGGRGYMVVRGRK